MSTLQETGRSAVPGRSAQQLLAWSRDQVEPALRAAVGTMPLATQRITNYHFGWEDEEGAPAHADGGKALRPALVLLAAQAVGGTAEAAVPAAVAVELVHNFSLLHDDVMDCDLTRRHRATAWSVFGLGPAILAGDALLSLAFEVLVDSGNHAADEAARMLGSGVQELVDGQLSDSHFETRDDVVLSECVRMAQLKTGALLGCSTALGALFGGGRSEQVDHLRLYGEDLGLAYQYVDDLLGIWGDPLVTGKPVHADLRRRKKSLPVIAALTSGTEAGRELAAMYHRKDDLSDAELAHAARLIERTGAREQSQLQADALLAASLGELASARVLEPGAGELERLARLATRRDR
ncbi:family 2 encapsulin nanocompartment cargo protein polyprenyl transferase [Kribbella sp. CA-293567]|uniref:family 2 encapsulin nanocompartment cargo protein polyprenyl transferase n=1 Tax=Kribbella sp. CA-293567 TaxID=3002436 RepID=UPI0022DD3F8F|nr:family 2 encapsulin nanocompartment cargo protein polyprenyl transferase [Kribbella sp. CA-293567]WBQ08130.1 family 2 encapsulin nanocompartment cargo protein polyprenyl transferase [Kribbella sp. CA-293567]